jgi:alkanesulfonate monooxygenase SsuD/methylene tetrahydromethanopterin reductase-like flavin-dependent oxidoreductase (luciferase family)
VTCAPKPPRKVPILVGGSGERRLMGIAARHADIWNNLATTQGELPGKVEAMRRRCEEVGRDPATLTVSQQCTVVIAETAPEAEEAMRRANAIFGGHLGGAIEAHGIWGTPDQVLERIERHVELGVTMLVVEFFGRDTTVPAQLFAETVLPDLR